MKKLSVLIIGTVLLMNTAFAGGILTNTNQSAQFARMLSRNASTDLDAVYFNPAGLTQLKNGFYFGLHNQTISQNKTISSEFPLKYDEYVGEVKAPVFPTAFAVYKLDNWAFSAGFGPNGGGGSAKYDKGLPSFEKQIARLVPQLSGLNQIGVTPPTNYNVDISFEGTSVFWGIQAGATYKINKVISVYGGARYLPSTNTYNGTISNIQLGSPSTMISGKTFLLNAAATATAKAQATAAGAASLQPLVSGGAGGLTTAQALAAKIIDQNTKNAIDAGLKQLGLSDAQVSGITIAGAQTTYSTTSATLAATASQLNTNSAGLADKKVDTKQTGSGITPIIGININLDRLNIGLKYEHQTALKLTNATVVDDTGLFPDKATSNSDIPAIIAGGADYKVTNKLKASGSFNIYLDKNVNWGGNIYKQERTIDKNYVELAFGLEYALNEKFAVSAGYLNSNTGVSEQYQSDFSYSNDSYTTGLGFQWNMNKKLVLDAGMMLTTYKDETKSFTEPAPFGTYKETYGKDTFTFAFGIAYKIF